MIERPVRTEMTDLQLNCPQDDLDYIFAESVDSWEALRGKRLFITGGTSFVGCWMLESLAWANHRLDLGASAVVLTRNVSAFTYRFPQLTSLECLSFIEGDARSFAFPAGEFSHVIHAATEAPTKANEGQPLLKFDTMVHGTQRALEFARQCGAQKFLLTSSGVVYAKPRAGMTHLPEDYDGAPDPTNADLVNGEGKRASEMLCALYHRQFGLDTTIARLFSFVGPYVQLGFHYAVGNFIRDGLSGGPIRITGDGTPRRSFLYGGDLAAWLWVILFRGEPCRPYNVGSEDVTTIAELAGLVAQSVHPAVEVRIAGRAMPTAVREGYVPSTQRARMELGLRQATSLPRAIQRTIDWYAVRGLEA